MSPFSNEQIVAAFPKILKELIGPALELVLLYYAEGHSFASIGDLVGRPEATIRYQVNRAEKKLRRVGLWPPGWRRKPNGRPPAMLTTQGQQGQAVRMKLRP